MSLSLTAIWGQESLNVTAVRYWSLADVTRIAIETTGEFAYKYDRLFQPSRVYYDIQNSRPVFLEKRVQVIAVGDSRVKQIRIAETQRSVTRVVLDLEEGDLDIICSQLTLPDRLVIEVRSKGQPVEESSLLSNTGVRRMVLADARVKPDVVAKESVAPPALPEPEVRAVQPVSKPVTAEVMGEKEQAPVPVAMAAKRNSNGGRSLTRALGLKVRRVVIDPGHGGHDHGTTGSNGLIEKELVLDVARRLGALIEERMGSEVIYTRTSDKFISLEERTEVANQKKADLFLSIHANSSPLKAVSGAETYYLSFTTSRAAMDLAARENASSERSVHELQDLIQKIALKDKVDESREFAGKVQSALEQVAPGRSANNRGVKKAPFVVLIGASMPSVLAEIGFVSNRKEEEQLKKPEYRQKIAEILYDGLADYAETLSHNQIAQTKPSPEN